VYLTPEATWARNTQQEVIDQHNNEEMQEPLMKAEGGEWETHYPQGVTLRNKNASSTNRGEG